MSKLEVEDCTHWSRIGVRGVELSRWLDANGYLVGERMGTVYPQRDGALVARISAVELLWLDATGTGIEVPREIREDYRCFTVSWRDSHAWFRVCGPDAPRMLAKICEVDFSTSAFRSNSVSQTLIAEVSSTVVRDGSDQPRFHLLAESSYAHYLWNAVMEVSRGFQDGEMPAARSS